VSEPSHRPVHSHDPVPLPLGHGVAQGSRLPPFRTTVFLIIFPSDRRPSPQWLDAPTPATTLLTPPPVVLLSSRAQESRIVSPSFRRSMSSAPRMEASREFAEAVHTGATCHCKASRAASVRALQLGNSPPAGVPISSPSTVPAVPEPPQLPMPLACMRSTRNTSYLWHRRRIAPFIGSSVHADTSFHQEVTCAAARPRKDSDWSSNYVSTMAVARIAVRVAVRNAHSRVST
jgi:hypothetical protein